MGILKLETSIIMLVRLYNAKILMINFGKKKQNRIDLEFVIQMKQGNTIS